MAADETTPKDVSPQRNDFPFLLSLTYVAGFGLTTCGVLASIGCLTLMLVGNHSANLIAWLGTYGIAAILGGILIFVAMLWNSARKRRKPASTQ